MEHPRPTGTAPSGTGHVAAAPPATDDLAGPAGDDRRSYLPALDGLRAVSVVAVAAYHLGHLDGGFLGVDVFFVVSGFLITRLLLVEHRRSGRVSLFGFWRRRIRRLVPALLVVLAATAVAARAWLPGWRLHDLRDDALAAIAYVANWRFVASGQSYFEQGVGPSPLRHTWSLAIEEQFYVLWPLVVLAVVALVPRRPRAAVGAVAAGLALLSAAGMALAAGGWELTRVYYGTDTRVFAVLAGAFVASWWDPFLDRPSTRAGRRARARRLAWAGSAALVPMAAFAVLAVDDRAGFYRGGFQAMALLSLVAVAGLSTGEGPVAAVLGSGPLRWVGRRSYGIYLWSWPVQVLLAERFELAGWRLASAVAAVTVVAAALSFRLVEEPVRTGHRPWAGRRVDRRPAPVARVAPGSWAAPGARLLVSLLVVVGVVSGVAAGAPEAPAPLAVSDDRAVEEALAPGGFDGGSDGAPVERPEDGGGATPFDRRAPVLVDPTASRDPIGVHGRPLRVMISGDSVGWSLGWGLGTELTTSVVLSNRALLSCGIMPPGSSYVVDGRTEAYWERCERQAEAERLGIEAGPDVVLLWIGAWEVYDQVVDGQRYRSGSDGYAVVFGRQIQDRIDSYRDAGIATVMPLVPCFGEIASWLGDERHDEERRAWLNRQITDAAERNPGWVRVVDPTGQLCEADGSAREENEDGIAVRFDGTHFDERSALWFWNTWLAGQMGAAFEPATD